MANRRGLITTQNILKTFLSPQLEELERDLLKNIQNLMKTMSHKFLEQITPKIVEQVQFKQFLENMEQRLEDSLKEPAENEHMTNEGLMETDEPLLGSKSDSQF